MIYFDKIRYNHQGLPKPAELKDDLLYWEEFLEIGLDVQSEVIEAKIAEQQPGQCCSMIFTSGTTV